MSQTDNLQENQSIQNTPTLNNKKDNSPISDITQFDSTTHKGFEQLKLQVDDLSAQLALWKDRLKDIIELIEPGKCQVCDQAAQQISQMLTIKATHNIFDKFSPSSFHSSQDDQQSITKGINDRFTSIQEKFKFALQEIDREASFSTPQKRALGPKEDLTISLREHLQEMQSDFAEVSKSIAYYLEGAEEINNQICKDTVSLLDFPTKEQEVKIQTDRDFIKNYHNLKQKQQEALDLLKNQLIEKDQFIKDYTQKCDEQIEELKYTISQYVDQNEDNCQTIKVLQTNEKQLTEDINELQLQIKSNESKLATKDETIEQLKSELNQSHQAISKKSEGTFDLLQQQKNNITESRSLLKDLIPGMKNNEETNSQNNQPELSEQIDNFSFKIKSVIQDYQELQKKIQTLDELSNEESEQKQRLYSQFKQQTEYLRNELIDQNEIEQGLEQSSQKQELKQQELKQYQEVQNQMLELYTRQVTKGLQDLLQTQMSKKNEVPADNAAEQVRIYTVRNDQLIERAMEYNKLEFENKQENQNELMSILEDYMKLDSELQSQLQIEFRKQYQSGQNKEQQNQDKSTMESIGQNKSEVQSPQRQDWQEDKLQIYAQQREIQSLKHELEELYNTQTEYQEHTTAVNEQQQKQLEKQKQQIQQLEKRLVLTREEQKKLVKQQRTIEQQTDVQVELNDSQQDYEQDIQQLQECVEKLQCELQERYEEIYQLQQQNSELKQSQNMQLQSQGNEGQQLEGQQLEGQYQFNRPFSTLGDDNHSIQQYTIVSQLETPRQGQDEQSQLDNIINQLNNLSKDSITQLQTAIDEKINRKLSQLFIFIQGVQVNNIQVNFTKENNRLQIDGQANVMVFESDAFCQLERSTWINGVQNACQATMDLVKSFNRLIQMESINSFNDNLIDSIRQASDRFIKLKSLQDYNEQQLAFDELSKVIQSGCNEYQKIQTSDEFDSNKK